MIHEMPPGTKEGGWRRVEVGRVEDQLSTGIRSDNSTFGIVPKKDNH
jgi:hypothetical protein